MSIEDAGILMNALYEYFDTDTELARQLRACFLMRVTRRCTYRPVWKPLKIWQLGRCLP